MNKHVNWFWPLVSGLLVLFTGVALTVFIGRQKQHISNREDREALEHEMYHINDKLRIILNSDIIAANALAVIYREYGTPADFDAVAAQILGNSKYAEVLQLTINGVIVEVYPGKGYEKTIGINTLSDSLRVLEARKALLHKGVYFAGPRKLRMGGTGILGKVQVEGKNGVTAQCVVLTRMETISRALGLDMAQRSKFSYELVKQSDHADSSRYFFSAARPTSLFPTMSIRIPEGEWLLSVAYSNEYRSNPLPHDTLIFGSLISFLLAVVTCWLTYQPQQLRKLVKKRTEELLRTEEYFRTLISTSSDAILILDRNGRVQSQTDSAHDISGYSESDVLNLYVFDLIHKDDVGIFRRAFGDHVNGKETASKTVVRLIHKHEKDLWVECTFRNLLGESRVNAVVLNYSDVTTRVRAEEREGILRYDLKERIKELETVYEASKLLQARENQFEETLNQFVNLIPRGWQFDDICAAKVVIDTAGICSEKFRDTPWKQTAVFALNNGGSGLIEVVYLKERPNAYEGPFLREERNLINNLAEMLRVYLNKRDQDLRLQNSESKFRGAFEYASVGMGLTDLDGRFLRVNKALCDMVGYSERELMNSSTGKITHPEDVKKSGPYLQEILLGQREYYRVVRRYIHKNGSEVWGNLNVSLIRDAEGRPSYFVGQVENITEKIESENKFRDLVERSLVGVYIIQDSKFVYVNPAILQDTGYTEKDIIGQGFEKFIHPRYLDLIDNTIRARLNGAREPIRYEVQAIKNDGTVIWIEIFGSTTIYRSRIALIGTIINITERKRAVDELSRSEANLRTIFNNTQVAYLLMDRNTRVLTFNRYFEEEYARLTGIQLTLGEPVLNLTQAGKRERLREQIEKVTREKIPVTYETQFSHAMGNSIFYVNVSPVLEGDMLIGYCMAAFDMTQRIQMEKERESLLKEREKIIANLVHRNRDLLQFSYILSHNVRGPLANILGLGRIAAEDAFDTETKRKALQGINQAAGNLDEVLMDLNKILQEQLGESGLKTKVVFQDVLDTTLQAVDRMRQERNVELVSDFSACPSIISVRSYQQSIFYNLIHNSIKYAGQGGGKIEVWSAYQDGAVILNFRDNGIGIDLKKHGSYIFGLYKRFHFEFEGKGIGLYMVKKEVELLNGNIELISSLGKGCHFIIRLPAAE